MQSSKNSSVDIHSVGKIPNSPGILHFFKYSGCSFSGFLESEGEINFYPIFLSEVLTNQPQPTDIWLGIQDFQIVKKILKIESSISVKYLFFALGGIWKQSVPPLEFLGKW